MKRGHVTLSTTLRREEATLVRSMVTRMEQARLKRCRHPETYLPTDAMRITQTGLTRAALRYVLEHEAEFDQWMKNGDDR